jgi:hypothetical protein
LSAKAAFVLLQRRFVAGFHPSPAAVFKPAVPQQKQNKKDKRKANQDVHIADVSVCEQHFKFQN